MNKKAFQAVLSSRESDRESFSIGDCYVTKYENPQGNPSARLYLLQNIAKRNLEDSYSTLEAEKTARVYRLFGASNHVNRADKADKFSGNSSSKHTCTDKIS